MTEQKSKAVYKHEFTVSESVVDQNDHVNNVVYVQWMQDVAVLHSESTGGIRAAEEAGGTWVVRSHNIEYLNPAFAGDEVIALTWVEKFQRVRSFRRYHFIRKNDSTIFARGETEWIFVDAETGRPRSIPDEVIQAYSIVPISEEPE